MFRLTGRENWDYLYQPAAKQTTQPVETRGRLPERFFGSYSVERFWSLVGNNLPQKRGQTVLEIGCAPGNILHDFARRFNCIPYGVDFSEAGVERTRENFQSWGYGPENVMHADVFDPEFQTSVESKFDIVVSRGFVEHFTDLRAVIEAHAVALRTGGLLVVSIPNYRGLNHWIGRPTLRDLYPLHNLAIMDLQTFRAGCSSPNLDLLWCRYFGGFDFGIFDTGGQTLRLKTYRRLQAGLNFLFRMVPPPQSRWTSPQLLCIARKLAPDIKRG